VKVVHWLVTLPIAVIAIVFAVSNLDRVPVDFWPFAIVDMPLYLIVLGALGLGFLGGELAAWVNGRHWRREARRRQRRIEALERELQAKTAASPQGAATLPLAGPRN